MAFFVAGLAAYDFFSNTGQTMNIDDNIHSDLVLNAVTNSVTNCFEQVDSNQAIEVQESPGYPQVENTKNCIDCLQIMSDIVNKRKELEIEANTLNSSYKPQKANPELEDFLVAGTLSSNSQSPLSEVGPCQLVCKDVTVTNINQTTRYKGKSSCQVQNNFRDDLSAELKGKIDAYLKNQQDIIGQLESIFTSSRQSIALNLSNVMSQSVSTTVVQNIRNQSNLTQNVSISGNSLFVSGISQSINATQLDNLSVVNTITNQLRQSAKYSITQSILNKNDTIGDLTKDYLQVVQEFSDLLDDLSGQILIIIGGILACIILVVGFLYLTNNKFRNWVHKQDWKSNWSNLKKKRAGKPNSKISKIPNIPKK